MAVQKSRKTRSKRGMRRNHQKLSAFQTTVDQKTGELHLRHHLTSSGYYKGKCILKKNIAATADEE